MSAEHAGAAPAGLVYAGIGDEAGSGLDDQITALTRLGWRWIELRNVGGVALADLDDDAFEQVAGRLADAGLGTVCVDSRIANWSRPITGSFDDDLAELDVLGPRCRALGTHFVRVMSYPNDGLDEDEWGRLVLDRMRALSARADENGLVLLHENCCGWAAASAGRMSRMLDEAGPALRLLFDIGNGVPYGYRAYDLLTEIAEHVAHVHVKDAVGGPAAPRYTWPGEGAARVADCLCLLLSRGYRGAVSIEPHLAVRPHERLGDAGPDGIGTFVEYGRRLMGLVQNDVLPRVRAAELLGAQP